MKQSSPIVLIDDDRAWLETLSDFLEGRGYRVRTAHGSRAGLDLLQSGGAGLAIVDFHMPEMDGLELLRRLRRGGRDLTVLLLTSDDDPTLPARARAAGARALLSKTLAPAELLRTLLQAVATAGLSADASLPTIQLRRQRWLPVPIRVGHFLPVPLSLLDPLRN